MNPTSAGDPVPALWRISTQWSQVNNPGHFVLRYADAIRRYLVHWLHDSHAADDVLQELLVQITCDGFAHADPERGRFRDYLIVIVRNAARRWYRRGAPGMSLPAVVAETLTDPHSDPASAYEQSWLREWRTCLLDRAFRALHAHEVQTAGNCYHSILRLVMERGDLDQARQAAELSRRIGRLLTHEAFRKALGRARRHYAVLLIREIAATFEMPTPADIEQELSTLELLSHVLPYLPSNWRQDPALLLSTTPK